MGRRSCASVAAAPRFTFPCRASFDLLPRISAFLDAAGLTELVPMSQCQTLPSCF